LRRALRLLAVAAMAAALSTAPAAAAQFESARLSDGAPIVTIVGEIVPGDEERFMRVLPDEGTVVVGLVSPGGAVDPALAIGELIRLRGYVTVVPHEAECTSSCALIWLAGWERFITGEGRVGFHAVWFDDGGVPKVASTGNAQVGRYLTRLGYGEGVVQLVTFMPPDDLVYLTDELAEMSGLTFARLPSTDAAPAPSSPAPSLPARVSPEAFVRAYFANTARSAAAVPMSRQEARRIAYTYYAPTADYFGKTLDRDGVARAILAYVRRWPVSAAVPGELRAFCRGAVCTVTGEAAYSASSTRRNMRSAGRVRFTFTLRRSGEGFLITAQNGEVIKRQISHLDTARARLVADIQRELARHGCNPGAVDGAWGPRSAGALRRFAARVGWSGRTLAPDGSLLSSLRRAGGRVCTG